MADHRPGTIQQLAQQRLGGDRIAEAHREMAGVGGVVAPQYVALDVGQIQLAHRPASRVISSTVSSGYADHAPIGRLCARTKATNSRACRCTGSGGASRMKRRTSVNTSPSTATKSMV